MRHNTDKSQRHGPWEKSDTEEHKWYESLSMKRPEQANPNRQKVDRWCCGLGVGWAVSEMGTRFPCEVTEVL